MQAVLRVLNFSFFSMLSGLSVLECQQIEGGLGF